LLATVDNLGTILL